MKRIIEKMALAGGALFLVFSFVMMSVWYVQAANYNNNTATGFTDIRTGNLKITGTGAYDANGTARIQLGSTNTVTGNLQVTGTVTPAAFTVPKSSAPRDTNTSVGITPTVVGQLAFNSTDNEICVSTGVTRLTWVMISSVSAAGANLVAPCRH